MRWWSTHRPVITAVLVALAQALPAVPSAAAGRQTEPSERAEIHERVETAVASTSPITDVAETVVRVKVPLPASAGTHPAGCDWLSYLRFRHKRGPALADKADRVLIAQPGILEGAGAFDSVARNTIVNAAAQGRHIEFWALDRRSNCLEDNTGVRAGLAARDTRLAVDYYYRGKAVGGRRFAGYLNNDQVAWLQHVGLEQTLRDQYDLMRRELPDPSVRKRKVLCGGHSLGGALTGFFAVWDFDGDHTTTADAGFNQCAGYFALDSRIAAGPIGAERMVPAGSLPDLDLGPDAVRAGLASGVIPRTVSAPAVVNAETMNLLAIAGLAARNAPGARSELATSIPTSANLDLTYRTLFSRDLANFVSGSPSVKDFRITNDAALGALLDDNSVPLAFIQTSVGFFDGGQVVDKDFPTPNDLVTIPELSGLARLLGTEKKAVPARPNGPLYAWRNYDRVGAPDDPGHRARDGKPFTTAAKEVTDIRELARSLAEHPLDFTEDYFPTRLVTDIQLSRSPKVAPDAVHRDGLTANPTLTLLAGDGIFPPKAGENTVVAPGYQHLDVLTAAAKQNNGRPEPVSTSLAAFATGAGQVRRTG